MMDIVQPRENVQQLAWIFHTQFESPTKLRARAPGLQALIAVVVGRVPSPGVRGVKYPGVLNHDCLESLQFGVAMSPPP